MNLDDDAKLARLLQERDSAYIDDGGFTSGVMERLPAPRPGPHLLRRFILVGGAAAVSSALAAVYATPGLRALAPAVDFLASSAPFSFAGYSMPLAVLVLFLLAGLFALWAVSSESRG